MTTGMAPIKISNPIMTEATTEFRWAVRIGVRDGDTVEVRDLEQKWVTREYEAGSGHLIRAEQEWRKIPEVRVDSI